MRSGKSNILNRFLPFVLVLVLTISASFHVASVPVLDQKTNDQEEPVSSTETLSVAPATISVVQAVLDTDFPLLETIAGFKEVSPKLIANQGHPGQLLKFSRVLFRLIISPNAP